MPKVLPHYTDDAKRRIVQAAMEAIAENGFEGVTIDAIGKKIGVTKGAVYWYFPSKDALRQEVLTTIETAFDSISYDPFFTQFDTCKLPPAFDRFFSQEEKRRIILAETGLLDTSDGDIPPVLPESISRLIAILEAGIEKEQNNGQFPSLADKRTLALALAVLCSGMQRGEIYAGLFLWREKIQRIWFFTVKRFLKS